MFYQFEFILNKWKNNIPEFWRCVMDDDDDEDNDEDNDDDDDDDDDETKAVVSGKI